VQTPRVLSLPQGVASSAGPEAVELAAVCGLHLDEWQSGGLDVAMSERADGSWAAAEVGVIASRQNGKNGMIEAREIFGLSILNEWIIHTSHLFTTTKESHKRLLDYIEADPDVKSLLTYSVASPASGYELRFKGGGRIKFIARSRSSGRGLTGDLLVFDEAQNLDDDALGALLPTISARPGAQSWYLGSAPDLSSVVLQRIRRRGRAGTDTRLAYLEHSADPDVDLDDRAAWAQANPALGTRITEEAIVAERGAMSDEMFARERLSISPDIMSGGGVISAESWAAGNEPAAQLSGPYAFAFDVSPDHSWASIAVACAVDGRPHVEVVDHRSGTDWVSARLAELKAAWAPVAVLGDPGGPAGAVFPSIASAGVTVAELGSREYGQACGLLYEQVMSNRLRHLDDPVLAAAVAGATKSPLGDAWKWSRRNSSTDITPIVAVTLALWGWSQYRPPVAPVGFVDLSDFMEE
jgi:hypothetical protein